MLVIFSGLPGTGKTTIARELARQIAAVYLRIDSIEQAIRDSGPGIKSLDDAGYRSAYAVAEDNLRLGRTVIADCVNPIKITRNAWLAVAARAGVAAINVEIRCSNTQEHKNRVENRNTSIPGFTPPTWHEVETREYEPWDREHLTIDTAENSVDVCVAQIRDSMMAPRKLRMMPSDPLSRNEFLQVVQNAPLVSMDLIVLDRAGSVLLGLRNNNPAKDFWFVPGGRIRKDESLSRAFRRITAFELGEPIASDLRFEQARFLGVFEHLYETNFADAPGFGTHYVVLGYEIKLSSRVIPPQGLVSPAGDGQNEQHRNFTWCTRDEILRRPDVHVNTRRYFE